jgi:hypothetical protein
MRTPSLGIWTGYARNCAPGDAACAPIEFLCSILPIIHNAPVVSLDIAAYYGWQENPEAYQCPQENLFCQQLLAAPFTVRTDPDTRLARQVVWLPAGDWYDFFTGEYFEGNAWYPLYCTKKQIPVFAKAGAIIFRWIKELIATTLPSQELVVKVFAGADNTFRLFEDDGESQAYLQGEINETEITQSYANETLTVQIQPLVYKFSAAPRVRTWSFEIYGISDPQSVFITADGDPIECAFEYEESQCKITVYLPLLAAQSKIELFLQTVEMKHRKSNEQERLTNIIKAERMPTSIKFHFMSHLDDILTNPKWLRAIEHHFTQYSIFIHPRKHFLEAISTHRKGCSDSLLDAQIKLTEWIKSTTKHG